MKITIKDIAMRADVSPGTVSKIITGKYKFDNVKISQETIEKVNKVVKELNYVPNYGARVLSTGKTFTIGICMPKSRHKNFHLEHYYSRIIDRIEKEAVHTSYDILLINFDAYITKFDTKRIDGLIIIEQWEDDKELEVLVEEKRKFVVINNLMDRPSGMTNVNIDNRKGIRDAVLHFKDNGHSSLAFIGECIANSQWKEQKLRLDHFISILEKEGMKADPNLFLLGEKKEISGK
ncbi:MAG: LacI family DNA-binding transcriptional regulator, partial [bacterium]|nr:LacI family DNA-binding transcriptional regulator [bacterium]